MGIETDAVEAKSKEVTSVMISPYGDWNFDEKILLDAGVSLWSAPMGIETFYLVLI